MTTKATRRTLIMGAAVFPALSLPAVAASAGAADADPIFAAIAIWDEYIGTQDALGTTVPTTRAGAVALIGLVVDEQDLSRGCLDAEDCQLVLGSLPKAIPNLA
jgi:uncharacterized protein (DUF1501 family)